MKWIFILLVVATTVWANTIESKQVVLDGNEYQLQVELNTQLSEGEEWRDVVIPATCTRVENERQCTQGERTCRRRCRFFRWGCRIVCTTPREVCNEVPRYVEYDCSRTERRRYSTDGMKVFHYVYIQVNYGSEVDVNEVIEVKAVEDKILVLQPKVVRHKIKLAPISSRSEISNGSKFVYHDVILELER